MKALAWTIVAVTALMAGATIVLTELAPLPDPDQPPAAFLVLLAVLGVADATVGATVATRYPANAVGWLFLLSPFGLFTARLATAWVGLEPQSATYAPLAYRLGSLLWTGTLPIAFFLFPDGRPPSRRWWRIAWLPLASAVVQAIPFETFVAVHLDALRLSTYVAGLVIAGLALIARFRSAVGIVRLQLASIAYAGAFVVAAVGFRMLSLATGNAAYANAGYYTFVLAIWLVPLAAGLAILRYRLYDITVVVRRTLVYGATTLVLGAAFLSGVLIVQSLLSGLTSGNELAVAGSTLATIALFQPLRKRIQDVVDRRFYRSRYDAARTLDSLALRLRDQVDLDALRGELLGAVRDTMRPAHASLWLRSGKRRSSARSGGAS